MGVLTADVIRGLSDRPPPRALGQYGPDVLTVVFLLVLKSPAGDFDGEKVRVGVRVGRGRG